MAFELPPLGYDFNALEPVIDARTMEIHHGKHHNAYVTKLNDAVENTEFADKPIEDVLRNIKKVPENIRQAVINNGGGHANHSLFWQLMKAGGGEPSGGLADAISQKFGSVNDFKEKFSTAGATRFGSGWAWLVVKGNGSLDCYSTANQDSPYMQGDTPILGLDVWEHAYYLNYQNRRPDYISAWWDVVDWDKVAELYGAAKG